MPLILLFIIHRQISFAHILIPPTFFAPPITAVKQSRTMPLSTHFYAFRDIADYYWYFILSHRNCTLFWSLLFFHFDIISLPLHYYFFYYIFFAPFWFFCRHYHFPPLSHSFDIFIIFPSILFSTFHSSSFILHSYALPRLILYLFISHFRLFCFSFIALLLFSCFRRHLCFLLILRFAFRLVSLLLSYIIPLFVSLYSLILWLFYSPRCHYFSPFSFFSFHCIRSLLSFYIDVLIILMFIYPAAIIYYLLLLIFRRIDYFHFIWLFRLFTIIWRHSPVYSLCHYFRHYSPLSFSHCFRSSFLPLPWFSLLYIFSIAIAFSYFSHFIIIIHISFFLSHFSSLWYFIISLLLDFHFTPDSADCLRFQRFIFMPLCLHYRLFSELFCLIIILFFIIAILPLYAHALSSYYSVRASPFHRYYFHYFHVIIQTSLHYLSLSTSFARLSSLLPSIIHAIIIFHPSFRHYVFAIINTRLDYWVHYFDYTPYYIFLSFFIIIIYPWAFIFPPTLIFIIAFPSQRAVSLLFAIFVIPSTLFSLLLLFIFRLFSRLFSLFLLSFLAFFLDPHTHYRH